MTHISRFMLVHGRLPTIEHDGEPWSVQGWLLPYVQTIHACHDDVPDRWGYWFEIMDTWRLPERPIPTMHFAHPNEGTGLKELDRCLDVLFARTGSWSAMRSLLEWLGYALSVYPDAPSLDADVQEELYRTFNAEPLLVRPSDYIGARISMNKGKGRWNPTAFFPTPHAMCECMVAMLMADAGEEDTRLRSVCDPCAGTGRMLLHASNHSLVLHGQDIDPLVVLATRINGALYAPWIAFPLPEELTRSPQLTSGAAQALAQHPTATSRRQQMEEALGRPVKDAPPAIVSDPQLSLFDV